ncbi:MAG: exopolysaccharide Pel transporter PelG, partial [Ferrovibrionaceae bacterium]
MAGIGFVLRRLTQRDDLLGLAQGYLLSALVSSGPWLLTVLAIAGVNLIGTAVAGIAQVEQFRIVIIYNFGFSLLFSGPILLVGTRYLADRIFTRDVSD